MRLDRVLSAFRAVCERFGLGVKGLVLVLCGLATLAGSLLVFGGATEDVTQHNGFVHHDAADLHIFTSHRTDAIVRLSKVLTESGAVPVLALLVVVAGILLWRRGGSLALALAPAASLGVAVTTVGLTKAIVGRVRPPVSLHLVSESDASFPSGHATNSTAVFLTIALVLAVSVLRGPISRALSVVCGVLLAGGVGVSRLVLGVHWPSDVLAGWALGVSVALAVTMTAALFARIAPPSSGLPAGRVRRLSWGVARVLATVRRPAELRAA